MNVEFIIKFTEDRPTGGHKIIFDYANELIKTGNRVSFVFVADSPFNNRRYNKIKSVVHYLDYLKRKNNQKNISWYKIDSNINIKVKYKYDTDLVDLETKKIVCDVGLMMYISEKVKNFNNYFYFIQHDEKIYTDENIVREAWKLPVKKIVVATWLFNLIKNYDSNVFLVRNYINKTDFHLINPIDNRKKIVSMLIHSNPYKGTDTGIQALIKAYELYPNFKVLLFGNFEYSGTLPNNFTFLGKLSSKELRENVYNESSVFLMPSILEGWGLVATEAMACGAALVSTANGGVDDFGIDNYSALVNDVGDVNGLAYSIVKLLKNDQERILIANNGLDIVNKLIFEKSYSTFESVIL